MAQCALFPLNSDGPGYRIKDKRHGNVHTSQNLPVRARSHQSACPSRAQVQLWRLADAPSWRHAHAQVRGVHLRSLRAVAGDHPRSQGSQGIFVAAWPSPPLSPSQGRESARRNQQLKASLAGRIFRLRSRGGCVAGAALGINDLEVIGGPGAVGQRRQLQRFDG
jgi:hypothetical protein